MLSTWKLTIGYSGGEGTGGEGSGGGGGSARAGGAWAGKDQEVHYAPGSH
jgi:hypothetical protein